MSVKLDSDGKRMFDNNGNLIPKADRKKPGTAIEYVPGEINVDYIIVENQQTTISTPNPFHGRVSPGQGSDGYGRKISTDQMLQFKGEKRKYRVYCTCFSNSGSLWINKGGKSLYLGTVFQHEIKKHFWPVKD